MKARGAAMENLYRLINIMRILRDPERGCPWDLRQTFASIVPCTIEEVYEVAAAIDRQDYVQLRDELGDLLLQVIFYTQMAREKDLFNLDDVAKSISDKLVRRHPQIFNRDEENAATTWDDVKDAEREEKNKHRQESSLLDDVPDALPQLLRAEKIQRRAARTGFDWQDARQVCQKIEEELVELEEVLCNDGQQARLEEELGDLLFTVVNLARYLDINAEEALRKSTGKFDRRFRHVEKKLSSKGMKAEDYTMEAMQQAWEEAKGHSDR